MLHGYCIRLCGQSGPTGATGVAGAAVELLEHAGLGVWFSRLEQPEVTPSNLRQHEVVVRLALRSATPLPLRFGSTFRDEDELGRLLTEKQAELVEKLARFHDRVEMGVRISSMVTPPAAEAAPSMDPLTSTGRAYLEARRKLLERSDATREAAISILQSVAAELAVSDEDSVVEVDATGSSMGSMAHLLHRAEVPLYREKLRGVQQRRPDLRISASGPWAPYSFV